MEIQWVTLLLKCFSFVKEGKAISFVFLGHTYYFIVVMDITRAKSFTFSSPQQYICSQHLITTSKVIRFLYKPAPVQPTYSFSIPSLIIQPLQSLPSMCIPVDSVYHPKEEQRTPRKQFEVTIKERRKKLKAGVSLPQQKVSQPNIPQVEQQVPVLMQQSNHITVEPFIQSLSCDLFSHCNEVEPNIHQITGEQYEKIRNQEETMSRKKMFEGYEVEKSNESMPVNRRWSIFQPLRMVKPVEETIDSVDIPQEILESWKKVEKEQPVREQS